MTSYRDGKRTGFAAPRLHGQLVLVARIDAAALVKRHVNSVRRYCAPVACDVATRALLYDLDAVCARFSARRSPAA